MLSNQLFKSSTRSASINRQAFVEVLAWLEVIWIALVAVPILLSGRLIPIIWQPYLVVGLFLFWPLRWIIKSGTKTLIWPLIVLLCWLPVSLLVSVTSIASWQASGYLLLAIGLYAACIHHFWLQLRPDVLANGLLVLGGLLLLIAPLLVKWKTSFRLFYLPIYDWFQAIQFSSGETIHANVLAGALILLLPIALGLLLAHERTACRVRIYQADEHTKTIVTHQKKNWRSKLWQSGYLVITILIMGLLLLTQSRGGYFSMAVTLIMLGLLRWPRLIYTLPVVAGGLFVFIYRSGFGQIFELLGADNTFGGADWRTQVWRASWQAFQDFAWTGIGIGNFQQVMPLLYPNPAIVDLSATHAHNLLLQIGLDLGLPGLVAYIIFYLTMIGMAIAVLRRTRSPQATATALSATWDNHAIIAPPEVGVSISTGRFMRQLSRLERTRQQHWALAAGCLAALVGMQVHGLLDAVTWGNKLAFLPWLIFAQITLLYRYTGDAQ